MPSPLPHRLFIAVPAADLDRANQRALAFDQEGGLSTFSRELIGVADANNNTADAPAIYYACCTAVSDANLIPIKGVINSEFPGALILQLSPAHERVTEQIEAFLAAAGLRFRPAPNFL